MLMDFSLQIFLSCTLSGEAGKGAFIFLGILDYMHEMNTREKQSVSGTAVRGYHESLPHVTCQKREPRI